MTSIAQTLKNIKSSSANGEQNLYNHLKKVISQIVINKQSISQFEAASSKTKNKQKGEVVFKIRQAYAHIQTFEKKTKQLAGKINIGTEQQPQQPASLGYVPDFVQQSRAFQKFGIGFGQTQSFLIFKSLCRFAQKKNAKQVRLWGKILGRQKDYYIAEGLADSAQQQGQLPLDVQPKGTGINKIFYWVATQLTGDWVQLPLITPKQLQISRKIKYLFTGDLNKDILSNPDFPGKQSHLLKCQLVRINTTCTIVPKGMYVQNAQDPKQIQSPQQFNFPDVNVLSQKQNWTYFHPSILKNGRTTIQKPQGLEPQQEQKWVKQATLKDPTQPRLKNIVLDNQNWSLRTYNLGETYLTLAKNPKVESKGIIGLKNLLWPGWLTVSYNGKSQSLYVGYGNKAKQNYYPCEPQNVFQEREDKQEFIVKQ